MINEQLAGRLAGVLVFAGLFGAMLAESGRPVAPATDSAEVVAAAALQESVERVKFMRP